MNIRVDHSYQRLFLDLDGTVLIGGTLFDGVSEALTQWVEDGREIVYLTNNTSLPKSQYYAKLEGLGLPVTRTGVSGGIITPVELAAARMSSLGHDKVFFLATSDVIEEFESKGIHSTEDYPSAVMIAFDKELTFNKLETASKLVNRGVPFFATHPDYFCPTPEGPIPDCGSFTEMISQVTGRQPAEVFGKPSHSLVEAIQALSTVSSLIVGDRLHTDIRTGNRAGISSCLVLTGESSQEDLASSQDKPDYVFEDLVSLIKAVLKHPSPTLSA